MTGRSDDRDATLPAELRFLAGGGAAAGMILDRDWLDHVLGPPEGWPDILKSTLSIILNSPESLILAWGRDDLTFFFNDSYTRLLGPRAAWAMGAPFERVWADAWAQAKPIIDDAFAGRSQRFIDLPWKLATDRGAADTWFSFSYSRILDPQGEIAGLFILTNETTAQVIAEASRNEAERRLRESEAQFRLMADSVPQIVWITDAEGRTEFFNRQWSRYTGVEYEPTTAAKVAASFIHPDDAMATMTAFDEARRSGATFHVEHRIRAADGTYRWFLVRAEPYREAPGGEITRWFGASVDIHDRRLAEAARRDSEARLRELADTLEQQVAKRTAERDRMWNSSPDLMAEASLDGVYQRANPAWRRLLGHDPADVVGTTAADYTHPDDMKVMFGGLETAQADTLPSLNLRFRHKDGSYRWIQWVAAPSFGLIFAIGRDVTVAVEAEEQLRQTEEALRQSQKMEAVGQLTGGVAHDFNNLLTIIRSSIDFLRRPDLAEDRRQRYLDAASDTVDRAVKLTSQLLAFARRQALRPETFDVAAKVRGVVDMLDTVTGARVRLIADVPKDTCHVRADVNQFETALVNMAVNARDAMNGEGVLTLTLTCHSALPAIRGHAGSARHFTAISIADTGSGIGPDDFSRIFEPFYTTKEVGKGTGLGLSQVFGFAKQSGGDIEVASALGEGATFTLYLPEVAADVGGSSVEIAKTRDAPLGTGQCILVVEDNVEVGRFCVQILEDLGYRAVLAMNAEEALDHLGDNGGGFDAVFSDVVMPGIGGLALARIMRVRLPDIPIVLASGYSHALAEENEHGFELLHKPYSAEQVAETLRRVLAPAS